MLIIITPLGCNNNVQIIILLVKVPLAHVSSWQRAQAAAALQQSEELELLLAVATLVSEQQQAEAQRAQQTQERGVVERVVQHVAADYCVP